VRVVCVFAFTATTLMVAVGSGRRYEVGIRISAWDGFSAMTSLLNQGTRGAVNNEGE
jgi:hypothetical protein